MSRPSIHAAVPLAGPGLLARHHHPRTAGMAATALTTSVTLLAPDLLGDVDSLHARLPLGHLDALDHCGGDGGDRLAVDGSTPRCSTAAATARYMAPVSRHSTSNASATFRATDDFPAPPGPSDGERGCRSRRPEPPEIAGESG